MLWRRMDTMEQCPFKEIRRRILTNTREANGGSKIMVILFLLLSVACLFDRSQAQLTSDYMFSVDEGRPPETLVGTIPVNVGSTYEFSAEQPLFNIDSTSGEIRTKFELDREQLKIYEFDTVVVEVRQGLGNILIEVKITVNDINDNAPSFEETEVKINFPENAQVGTENYLSSVTDYDLGANGTIIEVVIVSGNTNSTFDLEIQNLGSALALSLKLMKELDREVNDLYQLRIIARDNGTPSLSSYLNLNMSVSDVNDNAPTFELSQYRISLSETTEIGSQVLQVTATDRDIGSNGEVTYRLPRSNSHFDVDPVTGNITLISQLVYGTASYHSFRIEAQDNGYSRLQGRTDIYIEVIDYNDHAPDINVQFLGQTSDIDNYVTVEEGVQAGRIIAILTVTDADQGDNGIVTLQLTGGNDLGHFQLSVVSEPTYKITVVGMVDRELIPEYNLTVYAEDQGTPQRSSMLTIRVGILDANDHSPIFMSSAYSASLAENAPVGYYVTTVKATDMDTGVNAMIDYSISSGDSLGWFAIDALTGLVTTAMSLDRETTSVVTLTITATDQGPQPLSTTVELNVTIQDVNDVVPEFTNQSYQAIVPENVRAGYEVITIVALDQDLGNGGIVEYSFADDSSQTQSMFAIDPRSGVITTLVAIDREEIPSVSLSVKARDLGNNSLFSVAVVDVEILDVNDNVPIFYPTNYFAQVKENEDVGTVVETVSATDADIDNNGKVTYYMERDKNGGGNFVVDINTGIITTTQVLDRETRSLYTIGVYALDGGGEISAQSAEIVVTVLDIRDNLPTFLELTYNYDVTENVETDTFVGHVLATSEDEDVNITYRIFSGDPERRFKIDADGYIRTAGMIDREVTASYSLQIYAFSGVLRDETTVSIAVNDENDNVPTFDVPSDSVDVVENWSVGRKIYQAQARDMDVPPNGLIAYELTNNPGNFFNIEHDSGWVYINSDLQSATQEDFILQIRATDHGTPQLSSTLSLTVILRDVNNHGPVFEERFYAASITEYTLPPTRFKTVSAVDADTGSNGMVSYNITHGNQENKFGIFPDGQVYVRDFIDREEKSEYQLSITASDSGVPPITAVAQLTVTILDENDNRPFFLNASYDFYVVEEQITSIVGMVEAVDRDAGTNGEVSYSIISNSTDFQIDIRSGVISSQSIFDRERLNSDILTFQVEASDRGDNALTDRVNVNVHISDINDNEPIFLHSDYRTSLSELAPENSNVITVSAMDNDIGDNSFITYSIVSGDLESKFHLDHASGQISVRGSLDYETVPVYNLVVLARDAGHPSLSAMTHVTLTILDENDHPPTFQDADLDVEITECVELEDLVTSVSATDGDQGQNSLISYSIVQGNTRNVFRIDSDSGDLYLAKLLDHETNAEYRLNVSAQDSGSPTLTSFASVLVRVRDCNDNAPTFSQVNIVKEIEEGLVPGTEVATVLAQDFDSGINGRVSHSILSQRPDFEFFQIDEATGVISIQTLIDLESLPESSEGVITVIVQAIDQALPVSSRQTATASVTFSIRDVNDNPPEIVSQSAAAVSPGASEGTPVTTVVATDIDSGDNADLRYSLITSQVPFSIHPISGVLTVSGRLDSSLSPYSLVVRVQDGGSPPLSSQSTLSVIVTEAESTGPEFSQDLYSGQIQEGQPTGSPIVTVSAAYSNGQAAVVRYYITSIAMGGVQTRNYFSIDASSGIISTSLDIDRESFAQEPNFALTVTAADVGSVPPKTRSVQVNIAITDVNDNPPVFQNVMYNTSVVEGANQDTRVLTVSATDADSTSTDITYSIISGGDNRFVIGPTDGRITIGGALDRETKAGYTLTVRASDDSLSSTATVAISVLDVNDNNPIFTEVVYSFTLPEDTMAPSVVDRVLANDLDEGSNGEVRYQIVEEGAPGEAIFDLNPLTGELMLVQAVDFEVKQLYYLKIRSTDQGQPPLTSVSVIYINVLDVNDNSPSFLQEPDIVEVREDADIGFQLVTVSATDQDSGPNGAIHYTIQSGDPTGRFTILANGTVVVERPLDRETQSFYNLEVRGEDMAEDPQDRRFSTTQVPVILVDVNDNDPVFISPPEIHVLESAAPGSFVMKVIAEDLDVARNSYIEYKFEPAPEDESFLIGAVDGNLIVWKHLDRETVSVYNLSVVATDQGVPARSATMEITVLVDDVNDNVPVFGSDSYLDTIPENVPVGLEFLRVTATDADVGSNAWVSYTIVDGNYNSDFAIDLDSGVLSVAKSLDRERRQSYELTVRAQDSGPGSKFSMCVVVLDIEDVNDNNPVFPEVYRPVVIENNLPEITVEQVAADDADEGVNGALTYSLQGNTYNSLFTIDRTSGVIKVKGRLDHEERKEYTLTVVAEDAGSPPLLGMTQVLVTVADANDNPPSFTSDVFYASVEEEQDLNTAVTRVTANDLDSTAMLRYQLDGEVGNKFTIHPLTGEIVTAGRLDREEQSSYQLVVTVTDTGEITASATVFVTVTDINDNQPQFEIPSYLVTIPENAMAGTLVTVTRAVDLDEGLNAENYYSIESGDTSLFAIDHTSGTVTVSQNLSDQTGEFIIQVGVSSGPGSEVMYDLTTVHVTFQFTVQANYPSFSVSGRTQISLVENQPPGEIQIINANSPKVGTSGDITFHFAGGNEANFFSLNSQTGNLATQLTLDHEVQESFHLWIEARDGDTPPLSSFIDIIIDVVDQNDNAPVFEEESYHSNVTEGGSSGQEVIQVTAVDLDSGSNSRIRYSLSTHADAFNIDIDSGTISTRREFDREMISRYKLVVEAEDYGSPAQAVSVVVTIDVDDVNDNPMYTTENFEGIIEENVAPGTVVMRVSTEDLDTGDNAISRYRITSGNAEELFTIDEVSGDIAVTGSLNRESPGGSGHLLVVQAFDDLFNIDIPVTINVMDVNDNPPHFLMESYSVNIPELLPEGSFVLAVSATDQDLGDNGRIRYQLKALASMFNLDSETGHLTIGQVLGYQKPENMFAANPNLLQLDVLAVDHGFPTMYSEVSVTVEVFDANDHAPLFDKDRYFTPIPAGTPSGVNVIQVEAQDDLDEGLNAEVNYFIISGNGTSRFEVDQETGWIRILGNTLEGSIGTRYSLEIQAQDKGRPTPLSSTTFVELVITAANIHSPQFSQSSLTASVSEDQTTGVVATLHATDQDLGINGQVTYSITSGNDMELFSVDPSSGEIYLEGELDYELQTSHMLEITASDRAWETLSTTASLVVNVEDVDDNPPVFQQRDYFVTVPENTASAEYVTQVIAVDADSDRFAQFTYAIIGGSGENFFTLDENSGVVRTQGNLDYEQGLLEYQVTVTATNNDGSQRDTAHLHVEITGVNEFSPRFLQTEYEFTVSEGAPDGALVGSVLALDSDSGTDGKVLYLLIGASNDVGFTINAETGQLIVSKENGILDREMTDEVVLSVLAKNEGPLTGSNIDEATVTVHIIDANDAPVFDSEQYIASVREDADPQTYITTVTAEEKDQNPAFRQFIYTFRENSHYDLFDINEVTGRITLRGTLDRETTAVYNIAVAAVDSGTPPMTGTAEVIVTVEDVNDNGPVLLGSNAVGTVRENQPENTVVMTLNATDPDSGSNPASFRYRLSPLSDAFTLNFVTGELRTSKRLNREDQLDHYLQVEITDGGSPLMAATSTLRIVVEDENDQLSASRHARIEVKMYQSSFPGGPLGTVKPIDNDLGDTFDCDISSGDQSKFRIESDCILHAEAHSSVIQYTVNISGSDGVHPSVLSSFTVSFQDYYDATLDASITIQLSTVSAEDFLTFHYDKLLAAMSSILSSREEVIVLSLTDINDSDLNVLLAVKSGNGYMSKDSVVRLFQDNKASIESRAEVTITVIDFSACFSNQCFNQGICQSQHVLDFTATAVESVPIILVGPVSEYTFTCECSQEFFGDRCETQIDQCDSEPCHNGGQCFDLLGDFSCQCLPGFSGKQCQMNADECTSSPCRNGGVCADLINGYRCECLLGYSGSNCEDGPCAFNPCMNGATCEESGSEFSCVCPFGFWGSRCEFSSISFQSSSFLTYSSLASVENSIVLEFATTLPDALLVYNHDGSTNQNGHFFLIEVLNGRVHFSFNLGAGTVSMATEMRVDDGKWHRIQALQKAQNGELFNIDEACNTLPENACRATGVSSNLALIEFSFNDNPVFVGGVDTVEQLMTRHWQASTVDFVGCMRQISINGEDRSITSAVQSLDVAEGCDRDEDTCTKSQCGLESTCVDDWWESRCQCESGTCQRGSSSFGGESFVEYRQRDNYRRRELLNQAKEGGRRKRATEIQQLKLSFRTGNAEGVLIFIKSGQKFTLLEVEDSTLRYSYGIGDYSQGTVFLYGIEADDWLWHNVTLEREDRSVTLHMDDTEKTRNFNGLPHDFTGLELDTLILGGTATDVVIDEQELKGFSGCIQGFEFDGEAMPFSGANERFEVVPSENVGNGCQSVDPCASMPCGSGQVCTSVGAGFTCYNQPCLSSPCENGGSCFETEGSFICACGEGYTGALCTMGTSQVASGKGPTDFILIGVIAVVVIVVLLVVILMGVFLRRRYNRQPKSPKSNTYTGNGSLDNPTFINNDTFDDATMIGYNADKLPEDDHLSSMQRQPDIIDQNVQSSAVPSNSSPEVEKIDDNTHSDNFPEHYDIENASSIAPSDIDVAYHYRHYHDREGRRKKHRRSPNPMLARIQASPSRESPISMTRQSPNPFIGRVSPSVFGNSTPVPTSHYRYSPSVMLMQTPDGGVDVRRAASPYTHSEGRNIPTPVGSEHSELRSVAHRSDISSVRSGRTGRTKSPMSAVSVPSQQSRKSRSKTPVSSKSKKGQQLGLTADEVAKLNSARPDLMSGTHSHTSTIDNLSSVSDEANVNNLSRPAALLEPPETSSDESAASFTCSEMEPDIDTGTYIMSKLASIDNLTAVSNGRLDSDGGSQRTPFSSEDENGGGRGPEPAVHFPLDQLLNWGPSFQNLSPVCRDIAMLNDLSGGKKSPKVRLDANINGEEFV